MVVTGDRDSFQLVEDPHVKVLYTKRGISDTVLYDEAGIEERTGVRPAAYPALAALRGDTSDNLAGVPGVGEKTAAKLVTTYGDLDGIFAHLDELTPKLRENLAAHEEMVRRNASVIPLVRDMDLEVGPRRPRARPLGRRRGARSLHRARDALGMGALGADHRRRLNRTSWRARAAPAGGSERRPTLAARGARRPDDGKGGAPGLKALGTASAGRRQGRAPSPSLPSGSGEPGRSALGGLALSAGAAAPSGPGPPGPERPERPEPPALAGAERPVARRAAGRGPGVLDALGAPWSGRRA